MQSQPKLQDMTVRTAQEREMRSRVFSYGLGIAALLVVGHIYLSVRSARITFQANPINTIARALFATPM